MRTVSLLPHTQGQSLSQVPADIENGVSHGISLMGAPEFWKTSFHGQGIKVAIIDSGIDRNHPDLKANIDGARDYVGDMLPPHQYHAHGTHVAGTVAANGALKGMAPNALLRDYRVLNANGEGQIPTVTQAIYDACSDGCHIINLSLGTPDDDPDLHKAVQEAVKNNVAVIVAVGNDGPNTRLYPAYYPEVIAVGAAWLLPAGRIIRAWFSATNTEVDCCAPGVDVLSCAPGGGYLYMSGSSMGAPHVAGYAALLASKGKARLGRSMTETGLWEGIKTNTVDMEALGIDASTGAGFVTAYHTLPRRVEIQVTEGQSTAIVDGEPVELIPGYPQAIAETRNGFFGLPMAFVTRLLGGGKAWNATTKTGTFWYTQK